MNPNLRDREQNSSEVAFHTGQALLDNARYYPTVRRVALEFIQNELDAEATRIKLQLDYKKRQLIIQGNGKGISVAQFEHDLRTVCDAKGNVKQSKTNKSNFKKFGRWKKALFSPLGKCARYLFTSCPRPQTNNYTTWEFLKTIVDEPKL